MARRTKNFDMLVYVSISLAYYLFWNVFLTALAARSSDFKIVEENRHSPAKKGKEQMLKKYQNEKAYQEWLDRLASQEANFDLTEFTADLMFAILVFVGEFNTTSIFPNEQILVQCG